MKTLLVLYDDPDWNNDLPYNSDIYDNSELRKAYEGFAKEARKRGMIFARASFKWYKGKGIFSKAWVFDKTWKKEKNVRADVVFDKTPFGKKFMDIKNRLKKDIVIFNDPNIDKICSDKILTFKTYPDIMVRSFLVNSKKELRNKLNKIRSKKLVLKPVAGSSAKGLRLCNKTKLPKIIRKGTLVQEFIDASKGIPKFTKTTSDFRIVVCDGKIISGHIRKAKSGWISNLSRGGKIIFIPNNKIPNKLKNMLKIIDFKLKKYKSRLYTADFVYDEKGKPWLMEMNSKPGFYYYRSFKRPDIANKFEKIVLNSIKRLI